MAAREILAGAAQASRDQRIEFSGATADVTLGELTSCPDAPNPPRLVALVISTPKDHLSKMLDRLLIQRRLGYAQRCRCGVSFTRVTDGKQTS
jgi:hypothetical protein